MKMLNKKFVRTLSCAAVAVCAAAMLSVGAFAAEVDPTCVEGYLPPQEQMVQGDIALHSGDVDEGEKDPSYGGYGAPEGDPIQGDLMLIAEGPAETTDAEKVPVAAGLTLTGLFRKSVLFTARQDGQVLTLDAPASSAVVRGTIGDLRAQMQQGAGTLCVKTDKRTTTLNLALMCEGYADSTRFTLRTVGDHAYLTIGLRSRRDLLIGR